MSDQVPSPKPRRKTAKPFSSEMARDEILKKLEKAGAKGAPSLYTAKTAVEKVEVYERTITELEREREMYVDRRSAKPRFYLWSARPKLPTRESVSQLIEEQLRLQHPALLTAADLKKLFTKNKEAGAFLFSAVDLLLAEQRVVILRRKKPKGFDELYAHATSLRAMLGLAADLPADPAPAPVLDPATIRRSYESLVQKTGFPAVAISALQSEADVPLPELQAWLREQYKTGAAVFSFGDWSLADESKRAAAIEVNGDRYLLVRLSV